MEAATGLNLWREWAKIEVADAEASRQQQTAGAGKKTERKGAASKPLKRSRKEYAGIVLSLAKQEQPDTSTYDEPEIVYRAKKRHHAGLIVRSKKLERVEELLTQYATRFKDDFEAVLPPLEKAE